MDVDVDNIQRRELVNIDGISGRSKNDKNYKSYYYYYPLEQAERDLPRTACQ